MAFALRVFSLLPLVLLAISFGGAVETTYRTGVLLGLVDPARLAEYRLYFADTAAFNGEIEQAIGAGDYDYAESLYSLGVHYGHELSPDLGERARATPLRRMSAASAQVVKGFVFGSVDTGAEIGGTLASDLIGVGDVRDFSIHGYRYLSGGDYDPLLLGLSAAGIGLTAATYGTAGAASAADAGISLVKNAYKARRLSKPLTAYFSKLAGRAVNLGVMKAEFRAADQALSLPARVEKAAVKAVDRKALKTLGQEAEVLNGVRRQSGVRASVAALSIADGPKELRRLARVSARFGESGHAVLKFLGRSVLRITGLIVDLLKTLAWFVSTVLMALVRWPARILAKAVARRLGFDVWGGIIRPVLKLC
ncbi:hypothetical protein [Rhizobium halophytocola]|uniref:Uncharacterized protein n=1 Tax=Rhizobium halophytocola TaxID=735519 RepID=A0ABS4DY62_9HYPH|nr:hypothetical protein [Rhizobium halophytocola]MBP1850628.1 hypothetical protein [Rhizobium halophytocola]